jgi:hypothetical protein
MRHPSRSNRSNYFFLAAFFLAAFLAAGLAAGLFFSGTDVHLRSIWYWWLSTRRILILAITSDQLYLN